MLDAALYRISNPVLAVALADAVRRGVSVRVLVDKGKYADDCETRRLLHENAIPFRVSGGRDPSGSKLHDKFAVFDDATAATGSYNWTTESEEANHENLVVFREVSLAQEYSREFELLWPEGRAVE